MLYLERNGVDARIPDTPANRQSHGTHRVYRRGPVRANLVLAADAGINDIAAQPGARLIAYVARLRPAERADATRAFEAARKRSKDPFTPELIRLAERMRGRAVFILPPPSA